MSRSKTVTNIKSILNFIFFQGFSEKSNEENIQIIHKNDNIFNLNEIATKNFFHNDKKRKTSEFITCCRKNLFKIEKKNCCHKIMKLAPLEFKFDDLDLLIKKQKKEKMSMKYSMF